jgi:dTDP-4-dehydrorhamnose 3,5-epimerase-like enzyme/dTDP-4-dehydrorhamnose reductase
MSTYFQDHRGSISSIKEIPFEVKEILDSRSYPGVLRGLHLSPYPKRVIVQKGKIFDFFINPETLEKKTFTLTVGQYVDIPAGWAHGFYTYEYTEIVYLLGGKFSPDQDKTIYWNEPTFGFDYPFPTGNLMISEKDKTSFYAKPYDFFVLGARGFLGSEAIKHLKKQGYAVFESNERLEDMEQIQEQIVKSRAKYVICAAGISGKPTIEWSETNEDETYRTNFLGVLDVMRLTSKLNVHCTIFGSGQVFTGTKTEYTEDDKADQKNKVYTKWRTELEKQIPFYKNVLYLRIIYPCTLDGNAKCFLSKMVSRAKTVHPVEVCLTVVPSLFPTLSELSVKGVTGILNFVNRGTISLPKLLEIYGEKKAPVEYTVNTEGEIRGNYGLSAEKLYSHTSVSSSVESAVWQFLT